MTAHQSRSIGALRGWPVVDVARMAGVTVAEVRARWKRHEAVRVESLKHRRRSSGLVAWRASGVR
jgi:hypothetical protein